MNREDIANIYNEAFGEDEEFLKLLLSNAKNCIREYKICNQTVAFLFLLPVNFNLKGKINAGYYLFAAATKKEERSKGYMSKLIKSIIDTADKPIFLKPANDSLIAFYEKLGFCSFNATYRENDFFNILPTEEFLSLNQTAEEKSGEYKAMYYSKEEMDLNGISFRYTME